MEDLESKNCVFLCSADGTANANDCDRPSMFFCVGVSSSQVKQSSLLEGISGTAGVTQLPCGLSQDDFLLWLSCCSDTVRPPQANDKLARIIKVADALSDKRLQQWSKVLGERAAKVDWSSSDSYESMQTALQSLSSNARNAVLQAALAAMGAKAALTSLPPSLHASLIGAMIDAEGRLTSPGDGGKAAETFMLHLPPLGLPHSVHAPVHSLSIAGDDAQSGTANLLADALRTFTSLSQLSFSPVTRSSGRARTLSNSTAAVLLQAAWHATSLVNLSIAIDGEHSMSAETLEHLRDALTHLTGLQRLSVSRVECSREGSDDESTPGAHVACNSFLASVAAHPSLTSLTFKYSHAMSPVAFTGSFPKLQELTLEAEQQGIRPGSANRRLESIQHLAESHTRPPPADFSALTKLDFCIHMNGRLKQVPEHWLPFKCSAGECPQLRSLKVRLAQLYHFMAVEDAMPQLWRSVARYVETCTGLQHLHLVYTEDLPVQGVLPNLSALGELTSLVLDGAFEDRDAEARNRFLDGLKHLRSLQMLQLSMGLEFSPEALLHQLAGVQTLTELRLGMNPITEAENLEPGLLCLGLQDHRQLRVLRLVNAPSHQVREFIRRLPDLPMQLETLSLQSLYYTGEELDEALCAVVPQMQHLTRLDLHQALEVDGMFTLMTALVGGEAARQPELLVTHTNPADDDAAGPHGDLVRLASQAALRQRGVRLAFQSERDTPAW